MTRAPLWLGVFLVVTPACEDSTPVQRGFASRQVTQLRDRTLRFQGARGDLVLYSTVATDATHYWSVDIRTGAVREHDEMFSDVPVPQYTFPADPNARFHCSFGSDAMGRSQLQIDDAQTGERTTITGVYDNGGCPSESDPTIKLWRRDGSDHLTLWAGRYDDLQMVPIDLTVTRLIQDFRLTDVSAMMIASPPAQPDALGLYTIDLASFAVTELVPPTLQGGAWADGATPVGSLDSGSVFPNPNEYGSGVWHVADHFRYWRAMGGDGGETMFVGPLASGPARELALFHRDDSTHEPVSVAPADGQFPPQTPAPAVWRHWAGTNPGEIIVWNDGQQRLLTCPTDFVYRATGSLSPDGSKLALFTAPDPYTQPGISRRTVAARGHDEPGRWRDPVHRARRGERQRRRLLAGRLGADVARTILIRRLRSCGSPPATAARPGWWGSTASRARPPSPGSRPAASSISSSTAIWSGWTYTTIRSSRTESPSR